MSALGLADYGSSDEEDAVIATPPVSKTDEEQLKPVVNQDKGKQPVHNIQPDTLPQPQPLPEVKAVVGPALGPAPGPAAIPSHVLPEEIDREDGQLQPPASPYTTNRLLLRNLTMPPVANFEIPPSPPGSPPPATTTKFARFLQLKKKGVHFNERLNQSSALRNPGLLTKLMDFAGISQEDQYASALAQAVPTKFPEWAYADKLVKEHERIARKKEEARAKTQREAVDFVPAKRLDVDSRPESGASGVGRSSGERAGGRGDRPEAKRSRFDEKDRPEAKRGRFDQKDRPEVKRGRFDEKDRKSKRYDERDRRGGRRSRSPR